MQFSENWKDLSEFFIAFLESILNLKLFEKTTQPNSLSISEVTESERRDCLNA